MNQQGSGKTDVIVKLVLVFFISLLSFSIGTFVGKKYSDNQHKLAKYEPTHGLEGTPEGDSEANHESDSHAAAPSDRPMTDAEVAKLAEEFVNQDSDGAEDKVSARPEGTKNTESNETTNVEPLEKAKVMAHSQTAQNRNPSSLPASKSQATKEPGLSEKPSLVPSASGKFTVQVAAYPSESEAEKLAGDLKSKGFSAFYIAAKKKDAKTGEDKTWYRVSVGLFSTPNEANAYLKDLKTRGKINSGFVQAISN